MKRAFKVKSKFISFKGLSVARSCLRPDSAPLIGFNCLAFQSVFKKIVVLKRVKE